MYISVKYESHVKQLPPLYSLTQSLTYSLSLIHTPQTERTVQYLLISTFRGSIHSYSTTSFERTMDIPCVS